MSLARKSNPNDVDAINEGDPVSNNPFPAPQEVSGRQPSDNGRPTPSLLNPPAGHINQGKDRVEPVPPGNVDPPSVSQETRMAVKTPNLFLSQVFY